MAVYNNWPPSILLPRGSGKSPRLYLWWMSLPDYVKDIWVRCDELHKQNKDDQIFIIVRDDYKRRNPIYSKYSPDKHSILRKEDV